MNPRAHIELPGGSGDRERRPSRWSGRIHHPWHEEGIPFRLELSERDGSLSGQLLGGPEPVALHVRESSGNLLRFSCHLPGFPDSIPVEVVGRFEGERLSGTMHSNGSSLTWEAFPAPGL